MPKRGLRVGKTFCDCCLRNDFNLMTGWYLSGGKICKILFNCYGEFEGFVLKDCCKEHTFKSCEPLIGELAIRACKERLKVSVRIDKKDKNKNMQIDN